MPWIMFNPDNSFCSISNERFRTDFMSKCGPENFQVYLESDQIDDYPEDEISLLWYDPETNRAVFNEEQVLVGSERYKGQLLEWLEAYQGVPLDQIPDGETLYNQCVSYLGKDRTESYWADGFIDANEMTEIQNLLDES